MVVLHEAIDHREEARHAWITRECGWLLAPTGTPTSRRLLMAPVCLLQCAAQHCTESSTTRTLSHRNSVRPLRHAAKSFRQSGTLATNLLPVSHHTVAPAAAAPRTKFSVFVGGRSVAFRWSRLNCWKKTHVSLTHGWGPNIMQNSSNTGA